MKKVFLDDLPRKIRGNKECIDWENSVGYKGIKFIYDDIEGEIEIVEYFNCNNISIKYDNKIYSLNPYLFSKCRIGKLILGIDCKQYKYNVGDNIITRTGEIQIIEQKRNINNTHRSYKYLCLIDGNIDEITEYQLNRG